jgi:hypothetical protein
MKRHTWSEIKARTTPEVRARIEAEARLLSEDTRARTAEGNAAPQTQENGGNVPDVRDEDPDQS